MSVSKYRWTEACEGQPCPGDCDLCSKEPEAKNDDLISRKAAIDALERIFDRCEEIEAHLPEGDPDRVGYKMYPDWLTVWKYLHQLPSAQPEIVRCKDCKHRPLDSEDTQGSGIEFPDEICPCQCDDYWYNWR